MVDALAKTFAWSIETESEFEHKFTVDVKGPFANANEHSRLTSGVDNWQPVMSPMVNKLVADYPRVFAGLDHVCASSLFTR